MGEAAVRLCSAVGLYGWLGLFLLCASYDWRRDDHYWRPCKFAWVRSGSSTNDYGHHFRSPWHLAARHIRVLCGGADGRVRRRQSWERHGQERGKHIFGHWSALVDRGIVLDRGWQGRRVEERGIKA